MIKEKEGFKYSLKEFEGYKFRAKFVAEDKKGKQVVNTDIYTDNTNRSDVAIILCLSAEKKNHIINKKHTGLIEWTSKEQDDIADKFIEETLKDI